MKTKHVKGMIERKLDNPQYRERFTREYEIFKIEMQILEALERQGITYSQLAKIMHTKPANISRDLRQGGIRAAKMGRIQRMAEAVGLHFVPLLVRENKFKEVMPQLERLVA